jgi:hypothetical protein
MGAAADPTRFRYLILNYEAFQQADSRGKVESFVASQRVDFVVVDEIHYTKQRRVEDMSKRKQLVMALIALAAERNPELYVIGMSATPVINNLQEGKSLAELITGTSYEDLDTRATVPNCMRLHQQLVRLGTRWLPEYDIKCEIETPEIDCSPFLDELRALGKNGTPLALEQILTRARLPIIRKEISPKPLSILTTFRALTDYYGKSYKTTVGRSGSIQVRTKAASKSSSTETLMCSSVRLPSAPVLMAYKRFVTS